MRYLAILEYSGLNYAGFQKQKGLATIQSEVEKALYELVHNDIEIFASGRTDAGVHAKGQVIHFDLENSWDTLKLAMAINAHLPYDIRVQKISKVSDSFHARFSAKRKTYEYSIAKGNFQHPLSAHNAYQQCKKLDIKAMKEGAVFLEGEHDFTSFCSVKSQSLSNVRIIYRIKIINTKDLVKIRICGNGFLYNMVRIIAGTLLDVGYGKIMASDVEKILQAKERKLAGKTLPGHGLCLIKVEYK